MTVYEIGFTDIDGASRVVFVKADDMYTALSKWRTWAARERMANALLGDGEEPESVIWRDDAEIIP